MAVRTKTLASMTKAELIERVQQAEAQAARLLVSTLVLDRALTTRPDTMRTLSDEHGSYTLKVYNWLGAAGGDIVVTYLQNGQANGKPMRPVVMLADRFEHWHRDLFAVDTHSRRFFREVAEELWQKRNEFYAGVESWQTGAAAKATAEGGR